MKKIAEILFIKTKNPVQPTGGRDGIFGVDPTGFEPVSALVKGAVLPHELQARVHGAIIKQKKPHLQGLPLLTSAFARSSYEHRPISPLYSLQKPCQ
ncbi:MAG: hypothetical protein UW93_C0021G0005 [Parcubacteria group bacterium GW2011_GWC1_45_13]|nr:MAG: hypothetical protein UW93_C0021G0005 [Parcubacteria group bacterium GW2011_GWC1_45_13]